MSRQQARDDLDRFHRFARATPVHETLREQCGENLSVAYTKFGRVINRKVATLFSTLSDEEMAAACNSLRYYTLSSGAVTLVDRTVYRVIRYFDILQWADLTAILIPTLLRTSSSINEAVRNVSLADTRVSDLQGTPIHNVIFRQFTEQRVALLHGYAMSLCSADEDHKPRIASSDVEWFGQNRELIIPIWSALLSEGNFDRERVEVLLENADDSALSVIDGAL